MLLSLPSDPVTLNPVLAEDAYSRALTEKIFEGMVARNPETLKYEGRLAHSWEVSKDLLTYKFFLRKDVKFHDGEPFDADDVLFTYEKMMDKNTPNPFTKVYYTDVKSIEATDPYTIIFKMKKPYFKSFEFLGGFEVLPRHIYGKLENFVSNEVNLRNPVGTGPYKFARWKTGQYVLLSRNDAYYLQKPQVAQLRYRILKNETVTLQMGKKRQLDVISLKPFQWIRQTNSASFEEHFRKLRYRGTGFRYIGYNTRRAPFTDVRVRRAMTYLMNLEKIKKSILFDLAVIVTGPFWVNGKQYDNSIPAYGYDPAKALELLNQAGYKDSDSDGILDKDGKKLEFEVLIPAGVPFYEQFCSVIREDFQKIGVILNVRKMEFSVMLDNINKRDFQAVMLAWSTPIESDPYQIWHSSQLAKGHNFTGFSAPEMDNIIESARVEFDEKKRNQMYHRFHRILHDAQPYTFLFTQDSLTAVHKRFGNVEVYPGGLDPERWTILDVDR
ncbi:MAG: peptide-binding protein [Leptospiraceae bacterium]|nr:peptide-binding protein [Leptospiraceae bacterium]